MMATQADAHREWHLNAGVPMGTPGCPQDACHPIEDFHEVPVTESGVRCGNRDAHGDTSGRFGPVPYHATSTEVRECYASTGRFAKPVVVSGRQFGKTAEAEARLAAMKVTAPAMTFEQWCEAHEWFDGELDRGQMMAQYQEYLAKLPSVPVEQAVETMRANIEAEEATQARQAAQARYAAWRSIPVYSRARGYYALEMGGEVHFFRVERPTEGKHRGKTFAKEQAGDTFHQMTWHRQGEVLDAIAADPEAAAQRYGSLINKCSRCNRTLTDKDSRERGMGPDCAQKEW